MNIDDVIDEFVDFVMKKMITTSDFHSITTVRRLKYKPEYKLLLAHMKATLLNREIILRKYKKDRFHKKERSENAIAQSEYYTHQEKYKIKFAAFCLMKGKSPDAFYHGSDRNLFFEKNYKKIINHIEFCTKKVLSSSELIPDSI